jgi:hypothetical protein
MISLHPAAGVLAVYAGAAGLYLLGALAVTLLIFILARYLYLLPPRRRLTSYGFDLVIALPPGDVFDAISDVRRWPIDQPDAVVSIMSIHPEPLAKGSVIMYQYLVGGTTGVGADAVMVFDRGRQFVLQAVGRPSFERYLLDPVPGGTRLNYTFEMVNPMRVVLFGEKVSSQVFINRRRLRKLGILNAMKARLEGSGA